MYEVATALNIECSREKIYKSCEYRNEIIDKLISMLYMKDADKSFRAIDCDAEFGSMEDYYKAMFEDYEQSQKNFIKYRRDKYKSWLIIGGM